MTKHFFLPATLAAVAAMTCTLPAQKGGGGTTPPPPDPAIAFVEAGLKVMNADGTNARTVVALRRGEGVRGPAWSPDDSKLVFQGTLGGVTGLYRVNLDGTGLQLLVRNNVFPNTSAALTFPDWSPAATPDGSQRIVYSDYSSSAGMKDLYVVRPDGSGLVNLTNTPNRYEADATWSPDGRRLIVHVIGGAAEGSDQLLLCDVSLANGQLAIVAEAVVFTSTMLLNTPRWAQTHDVIAFSDMPSLQSPISAWLLDLTVPAQWRLTGATSGSEKYASFRGDDQKLCFQRSGGAGSGIWTVHVNGTGELRIRGTGVEPNWRHRP